MNDQPTNQESRELLTELPNDYFKIFAWFFDFCMDHGTELPTIQIPLFAAVCLVSTDQTELLDFLRAQSKDTLLQSIITTLDLVKKVKPESANYQLQEQS